MARRNFKPEQKAEARRLRVEENWPYSQIGEKIGCAPQTIHNWANAPNKDGRTWEEERQARNEQLYEDATPDRLRQWMMDQMVHLMQNSAKGDPKVADAFSKFMKSFRTLFEQEYQYALTVQVMIRLPEFLAAHYPDLMNERSAEALRDFKDEERRRLLGSLRT